MGVSLLQLVGEHQLLPLQTTTRFSLLHEPQSRWEEKTKVLLLPASGVTQRPLGTNSPPRNLRATSAAADEHDFPKNTKTRWGFLSASLLGGNIIYCFGGFFSVARAQLLEEKLVQTRGGER